MIGDKYISLREAARITGYAPDYIGQLARRGEIRAKKLVVEMSSMWLVHRRDVIHHARQRKKGHVSLLPPTRSYTPFRSSPSYYLKKRTFPKASVAILLLLFLFGRFYLPSLLALSSTFYPENCLGDWRNPTLAQGKPDLPHDTKTEAFSEQNSAVFDREAGSEIFCGSFTGDWPLDSEVRRATLSFSLGVVTAQSEKDRQDLELIFPAFDSNETPPPVLEEVKGALDSTEATNQEGLQNPSPSFLEEGSATSVEDGQSGDSPRLNRVNKIMIQLLRQVF
ncbi:MAG: helix-turn-helix domain-containing protein [Parcubacteria group bacterium]|nr:helix-turn-helix domain-containing protein [Parcubacteria group bacterium]